MQKVINQIMEENFDYENGSLDFSCAKIEISLNRGRFMRDPSAFMPFRGSLPTEQYCPPI